MVAYNFKERFADLVASGAKTQTIRAPRRGRCRHAFLGERVQLYVGMRTKACRKLVSPDPILDRDWRIRIEHTGWVDLHVTLSTYMHLPIDDTFAQADGFKNADDMLAFFDETYGLPFDGVLIGWRPAGPEDAAS